MLLNYLISRLISRCIRCLKCLLPHLNLHQLFEKAAQSSRMFFNEPIRNLFEIEVFTVVYFH